MTTWQYLTVDPTKYFDDGQRGYVLDGTVVGADLDDLLTRFGAQGWELVTVRFAPPPTWSGNVVIAQHDLYLFKREKA